MADTGLRDESLRDMGMLEGTYYRRLEIPLDYFVPWKGQWAHHLPKHLMNMLVRLLPTSLRSSSIAFLLGQVSGKYHSRTEITNSTGDDRIKPSRDQVAAHKHQKADEYICRKEH